MFDNAKAIEICKNLFNDKHEFIIRLGLQQWGNPFGQACCIRWRLLQSKYHLNRDQTKQMGIPRSAIVDDELVVPGTEEKFVLICYLPHLVFAHLES